MKKYLERRRLDSIGNKYRYEYLVECSCCAKQYWTKSYPSKVARCRKCAGVQSYTPAKESRSNQRKRGEGYITKQGYLLIYNGTGYVPAHRIVLPPKDPDNVIHHIDGDYKNNNEDNLQLICPNCHSLTETYKSHNKTIIYI